MDSQEDQAPPSSAGPDQAGLPAAPIPAQERQQLLSRLPPDVAPSLKAAADGLSNTADAQVCSAQTCHEMCRHAGCEPCTTRASVYMASVLPYSHTTAITVMAMMVQGWCRCKSPKVNQAYCFEPRLQLNELGRYSHNGRRPAAS